MRLTVVQSEDRRGGGGRDAALRDLLLAYNAWVTSERRPEVRYLRRDDAFPDHPPYWRKVLLMEELVRGDDPADPGLWLWLDSDAYLGPADARDVVPPASGGPHSMWVSPDMPPLNLAPFCAGAFLVRADAAGRRLMAAWAAAYPAERWRRRAAAEGGGGWTTDGVWAGPAYEQGAFVMRGLLRDPAVRVLPSHVFSEARWRRPHPACVAVHLAGHYRRTFARVRFAGPSASSPFDPYHWPLLLTLLLGAVLAVVLVSLGRKAIALVKTPRM